MCDRMRVSHSHLLGGPSVWVGDDLAKALAYESWRQAVCDVCGTESWEWDPARGGHREAYIGHQTTCPGDVVLAQENENIQALAAEAGTAAVAGIRAVLMPRELALALAAAEQEEVLAGA